MERSSDQVRHLLCDGDRQLLLLGVAALGTSGLLGLVAREPLVSCLDDNFGHDVHIRDVRRGLPCDPSNLER